MIKSGPTSKYLILQTMHQKSTHRSCDQTFGEFLVTILISTHQQVFDKGLGMAALLTGVLKEHVRESGHVDIVTGEVRGHGQVGVGGIHFHIDLTAHLIVTGIFHIDPILGHNRFYLIA